MNGRRLNTVKYRCAECGDPKRYGDDFIEGEGVRVLVCRRHPEAKILSWSYPYEAALYAIDREMRQYDSIEALRDHVMSQPDPQFRGFTITEFAVVAALYKQWGGMPETRLPDNLPNRNSPLGLYG